MSKIKTWWNSKCGFWVRFATMVVVGVLTPIIYLIIKYDLFNKQPKITLGLWGFIAVCFVALAIIVLIKFYVSGVKTKYSWWKQLIDGFCKLIIPIVIFAVLMYVGKNYTTHLVELCWVLIPCELVAIMVNPLPKWAFDNNVEGLSEIANKIFTRNNKGGEE